MVNQSEDRRVLSLEWEQQGDLPQWMEFPDQKRQEVLLILAGMLLNCERPTGEAEDEAQS